MVLDRDFFYWNENCKEKVFDQEDLEEENMRNLLVTLRKMERYSFQINVFFEKNQKSWIKNNLFEDIGESSVYFRGMRFREEGVIVRFGRVALIFVVIFDRLQQGFFIIVLICQWICLGFFEECFRYFFSFQECFVEFFGELI